jgi:hypothetical protein
MQQHTNQRLARLRGSLRAEAPGARGLERVARNPACQRLRAITTAGVTPAGVVKQVYREDPREGQSPFAISAGNQFEHLLYEDEAARLLELYQRQANLPPPDNRVVDVPTAVGGRATPTTMRKRRELTDQLFLQKLQGDPQAPNLILHPRVPVSFLEVPHDTEPDALVAADADRFYRPVEVKSYPDRGGKTDPADVRSACRQAAVGVVGLRQAVGRLGDRDFDRLGTCDVEQIVPPRGDLVLRVPGSMTANLRPMTLQGEVDSLERALDEAPRNLDELEALLAAIAPNATLDNPRVLEAIPCNYLESCREHCALADRCKAEATANSDPVILGSAAREELAAAGSVERALELIREPNPVYRTREEEALAHRLREAVAEYHVAVSP